MNDKDNVLSFGLLGFVIGSIVSPNNPSGAIILGLLFPLIILVYQRKKQIKRRGEDEN